MKRMTLYLFACVVAYPAVALDLVDQNGRRWSVERTADSNVVLKSEAKQGDKKISFLEFSLKLNLLYQIPPTYSGSDGLARLMRTLELLRREEDEETLDDSERASLQQRIKTLTRLQRRLIVFHDVLYQSLEPGSRLVIDTYSGLIPSETEDVEKIKAAFDPLWFDGSTKVWKLASLEATYFDQATLCLPPFRAVLPEELYATVNGAQVATNLMNSAIGASLRAREREEHAFVTVWAAVPDSGQLKAISTVGLSPPREFHVEEAALKTLRPVLCVYDFKKKPAQAEGK